MRGLTSLDFIGFLAVAAMCVTAPLVLAIHREIRKMTTATKAALDNLSAKVTALEAAAAASTSTPDDVAPALDAIGVRVQAVTDSLTTKAP